MSTILLEKIHKSKEEDQRRMNKVCQKTIKQDQLEQIHNNILNNKLIALHNKEKIDYFNGIKQMAQEVGISKDIIQSRNRKNLNKEEIFEQRMHSIHNNWDKFNVNRFYHKKSLSTSVNSKTDLLKRVVPEHQMIMNIINV